MENWTKKEIEEYKAIRTKGEKVKSITILDENASVEDKKMAEESIPTGNIMMEHPLHDTGSKWYFILSLFLPLLGLIGAFIFKHFKHFRNGKACLKGALTGIGIVAAVVIFFALMLLRATL